MLLSYLARVGTTLAGSAARGRAGPLDELRQRIRVWPTDIDAYGHVNNGRTLTLMDFGRLDYAARTGLLRVALRERWRPLLAEATVRFRGELALLAAVDLVTRLVYWDDRWCFFEHRLERGDRLFATSYARVVVKHARATVPPSAVLAAVGHSGPPPEPPAALARWASEA